MSKLIRLLSIWPAVMCLLCMSVLPAFCQSPPSTESQNSVVKGPPFFVIGVWYQPSYTFDRWKARGINTMLGYESLSNTVPFKKWNADLAAKGLYTIRKPQGDLVQDSRDPRLLAWKFDDEPDLADKRGKLGSDPVSLLMRYHEMKAAAPNVPVLINLSGGEVRGVAQTGQESLRAKYQAYCQAADWISQDLYPVTGWVRPDWIDLSLPIALPQREPERYTIGWTLDKLRELSGGKPQFQILECSNQNLPWLPADKRRSPTAAEFRGEVWHAVIHGAVGISYFPQQIGGGFKFDATPPDVEREMIANNRVLGELSEVLLAPGERMDVAAPFEAATRRFNDAVYTFVLNFSSKPTTYNGERFGPYEVRISRGQEVLKRLSAA